ncbi:hypothetical protein U91I_02122 [alpha proteobacterium U9-1i]|nr:hypothetical protein U91I_02122 [alpha proteobacterium U9-1i]
MALAGAVTLSEIPTLAAEVEGDARALAAQTEVNATFIAGLEDFSSDALRLSDSLREAGVTQDMPCIFRGISEDARERVEEFQAADTATERTMAFNGLKALLDDAILLAPMAAGAAADVAVRQDMASR